MAENKLEFEIDPEVAQGQYSNFVIIAHSPSEAKVGPRFILTPEHAKRLLRSLQENLSNYENKFGTIKVGQGGGFKPMGQA